MLSCSCHTLNFRFFFIQIIFYNSILINFLRFFFLNLFILPFFRCVCSHLLLLKNSMSVMDDWMSVCLCVLHFIFISVYIIIYIFILLKFQFFSSLFVNSFFDYYFFFFRLLDFNYISSFVSIFSSIFFLCCCFLFCESEYILCVVVFFKYFYLDFSIRSLYFFSTAVHH